MQSTTAYLEQELERYRNFPGAASLGNRKYSPTYIARIIIQWCELHGLPKTPEQIVDGSFVDGWFVRSMYFSALVELVHKGWLSLANNQIDKTEQWPEAIAFAEMLTKEIERHDKALSQSSLTHQEGRLKMVGVAPACVRHAINAGKASWDYPRDQGVGIDRANYHKRVVCGADCIVEFGKRHFHFDSTISKRRETISAVIYVPATILDPGERGRDGTAQVQVGDDTVEVEAYRITRVIG